MTVPDCGVCSLNQWICGIQIVSKEDLSSIRSYTRATSTVADCGRDEQGAVLRTRFRIVGEMPPRHANRAALGQIGPCWSAALLFGVLIATALSRVRCIWVGEFISVVGK